MFAILALDLARAGLHTSAGVMIIALAVVGIKLSEYILWPLYGRLHYYVTGSQGITDM